jgi:phosphopantothenoylcysteine decarboxylase/phosphopantothenate--cysteine ligase
MWEAVRGAAATADVIVKAAAVADFRPVSSSGIKLKKAQGPPDVSLEPTIDILRELGRHPEYRKEKGMLVGFAAETEADPARLAEVAEAKRTDKGADMIVANDVGSRDSGFDVPTNRAVIVDRAGVVDVGLVTKKALATALIDRIVTALV